MPARRAAARRASAYCCFLPDLAGLGGARPHGSWQGNSMVQRYGKKNKMGKVHYLKKRLKLLIILVGPFAGSRRYPL